MLEYVWPQTNGEWLAWTSACLMLVFGLWMFLIPRWWLTFVGLAPDSQYQDAPQILTAMRGTIAGGNIGLGLAVLILHPQPLLYIALGSTMLFRAIGRIVSMAIDQADSKINLIAWIFEGLMAFFPLADVFGLIV